MINRDAHTDDGAGGSEDFRSGGRSYRRTDTRIPRPDYDNLIPAVRLDEAGKKTTDRSGRSINNAHYDNCAANNNQVVWCKIGRGGSRNIDNNGHIQSNDRCSSGEESCNRCCTCCKADLCGNVVVGTIVKCEPERVMGNDLFVDHLDSVSDASISGNKLDNIDSAISNQKQRSGVCINTSITNNSSGIKCIDVNQPETLNVSCSSLNTGQAIKCEKISGKCDETMSKFSNKNSGVYSIISEVEDEENNELNCLHDNNYDNIYDNNYDNPVTLEERFSLNGLSHEKRNSSSASSLEKDVRFDQKINNKKRSVAFKEVDTIISSAKSEVKSNFVINSSSDRNTSMTIVNLHSLSEVTTPAIIITPSTPKKTPSKQSTNKTQSDLDRKKFPVQQAPTLKAGKKHTEAHGGINKKTDTICERKHTEDFDLEANKKNTEIHKGKYTKTDAKTSKDVAKISEQKFVQIGMKENVRDNRNTGDKQAHISAKKSQKCFERSSVKQIKVNIKGNKKKSKQSDDSQTQSPKNSFNGEVNSVQKLSRSTPQAKTKDISAYTKTTLPSDLLTSAVVYKLEGTVHQGSQICEPNVSPNSREDSENEIALKKESLQVISESTTSNIRSAGMPFPAANEEDSRIEININSKTYSALNSKSHSSIQKFAHGAASRHSEGKSKESTREDNRVVDSPVLTRELNAFKIHVHDDIANSLKHEVINSKYTKTVDKDASLTEPDVDSLLESDYSTIPGCSKSVVAVCGERVVIDTNDIHNEVMQVRSQTYHNKKTVEPDREEDIYAIPVPKSLRKVTSSQENTPAGKSEHENIEFLEEALPLKPSRSPNVASPQFQPTGIDIAHPVSTNKVEVTCEIKKSSTTEALQEVPEHSDYSNIPKYGRYDFFSLGRQPKILRTVTSINKKGTAINLEMMLRFRRQSLTDIPSSATPNESLSVEDILSSCSEFEQNSLYFRNRTSSDSTQNVSWYSMSAFGASNVHSKIYRIEETEKLQAQVGLPSFTSILKKTNIERSGSKSILKTNKVQESSINFHVKKINFVDDVGKSDCDGGRMDSRMTGKLGVSGKNVSAKSFSSSQIVLIGQNDLEQANKEPVFKSSKVGFIGQNDLEQANQDALLKSSKVVSFDQDCIGIAKKTPVLNESHKHLNEQVTLISRTETSNGLDFVNNDVNTAYGGGLKYSLTKDITDFSSRSNDASKTDSDNLHSSDYDSLENAVIMYPFSAISSFLPREISRNFSGEMDCKAETKNNHSRESQSDFAAFSSHPFGHNSIQEARQETLTPSLKVKEFEMKPMHDNTQTPSTGKNFTRLAPRYTQKPSFSQETYPEFCQEHTTPVINSASACLSYDLQSQVRSIVSEPLSPVTVFSDSPEDSSPGVISSLSVDVFTDPRLESVQSPAQKSPTYNAKLETAEALKWLRAAGFPQYAQMFVERQFPVDMRLIENDHEFLDRDSLKSLFRRLQKLNKHADLSLDTLPGKKVVGDEDDDDEYLCALSDRWEYSKSARRWSRKSVASPSKQPSTLGSDPSEKFSRFSSHDSLLDHGTESQPEEDNPLSESKKHQHFVSQESDIKTSTSSKHTAVKDATVRSQDSHYASITPQENSSSDRNKSTKSLFKKMEGLKPKKPRGQSKRQKIKEISEPIIEDSDYMRAKLEMLNCVDISHKSATIGSSSQLYRSFRTLSTEFKDRERYVDVSNNQISPRSHFSSASTRPQSDFISRSIQADCPSPFGLPPKSPHESGHNLEHTQKKEEDHYSSPYTNNQTKETSLKNLWSCQGNDAHKILLDTTVEVIAPDSDTHQSGRFPLKLSNGCTETIYTTVVRNSTANVSSRKTDSISDGKTESLLKFSAKNKDLTHRKSIYDNLLPSEINREGQELRMIFPGIYEVRDTEIQPKNENEDLIQSNERGSLEVRKHNFSRDIKSEIIQRDSSCTSRSSLNKTFEQTHKPIRDRSVSFETNLLSQPPKESNPRSKAEILTLNPKTNIQTGSESSQPQVKGISHTRSPLGTPKEFTLGIENEISSIDSQRNIRTGSEPLSPQTRGISHTSSPLGTPKEITLGIEAEISSIDSRSSTRTGSEPSPTKSRSIFHSQSADSYFRDGSSDSRNDVAFGNSNASGTNITTLKKEYEDLDMILEQLYHNIDELTNFMNKEQQAQSTPSQNNNSFGVYGNVDLDTETSLSGGESSTTTGSSTEDPEFVLTDYSRDNSIDQISRGTRERNDSGVGHSLPRAKRERQRKKIRWHSFQKSHRPAITSKDMQINSLTVNQMVRLQKLSLLKLTAIMEKCLPITRSGWNWMMPRFLKKQKITDFSDKKVFGVPFIVMTQRTGQPLPQCVLYAMRYLRRNCSNAVGIFRKSGVKSKIQQLRDDLENDPDTVDFEGMNAYNVADMLKTYFRDLPECLLTNKISDIFRNIYLHVPPAQRLEAIQTAIVLLPDENREVLQSVLLFLSDISSYEADHQMNASNLAVCFTPTVFQLGPEQVAPPSPKRNYKNSPVIPDPFEIMEQKAAHECLLMMILECKKLFTVAPSLYQQVQGQSSANFKSVPLQEIVGSYSNIRAFGQERIQMVLKEAHEKNRGWIQILTDSDVEVFCRKPLDDCPLKEWKLVVEIEAPPIEVLHRIMHERHVWDEDLLNWSVIEKLDSHSDIFQFVLNSMAPHPCRHFCVLRYWRSDLNKGACALTTVSVDHADVMDVPGVAATDLGSYFLMEPCGSGRSRLTHITRMDTRGRAPEWYTRIFGHFCANFLDRLRESFKQVTSGPETKV